MNTHAKGFALPTVMIASVVMLMVLLSGLVAASSVNTTLRNQYYEKLAKEASEAGVAMARMCLEQSDYVAAWTALAPLRPNTGCDGSAPMEGSPAVAINCGVNAYSDRADCNIVKTDKVRTTFTVDMPVVATGGSSQRMTITGKVDLKSPNGTVVKTVTDSAVVSVALVPDYEGTRASERFWYFGYRAGLDFGVSGTSDPVASPATCSSCIAQEGSTVATDRNGKLLFWTNGIDVWNRAGAKMDDGTATPSTPLNGASSTTQASLIFPLDSTQTKYVIVTNNAVAVSSGDGGSGRLYFSVIDMTANGGAGQIVQKNVPVWSTGTNYTSEAAAAAPKADGSGFWILAPDPVNTTMRVFELNNFNSVTGDPKTAASPVAAVAPGITPGISQPGPNISFSTLNFNDDYSRIVLMQGRRCVSSAGCTNENSGLLRTMKFNTKTGAITNEFAWNNSRGQKRAAGSSSNTGYSADFSPQGKYVYATRLYGGTLHRYNVSGGSTPDPTQNNGEFVGYTSDYPSLDYPSYQALEGGGQVKRGPNGKMYVANRLSGSISVVNNPDEPFPLTNLGWDYNGVNLGTGITSSYGLPETSVIYNRRNTLF